MTPETGLAAIWCTLVGLVVACFVVGCSATPEACGPEALAAIGAQYQAEALQACAGRYTIDDCPAMPEIEARAAARRAAWVRCEP